MVSLMMNESAGHASNWLPSITLLGQALIESFFEEVEPIVPKENVIADNKDRLTERTALGSEVCRKVLAATGKARKPACGTT